MSDDEEFGRYIRDVVADFEVVKGLLNDGRPLEALQHVNESIDRYREEMERGPDA